MPGAESIHCVAHLGEDIEGVIPYLNAELGGTSFTKDPLSVTFKVHGKLITIHPMKVAINELKDENEAEKILQWLKNAINKTWERRNEIEPIYEGERKPVLLEILKLLPKTNCLECNEPTCMVFAARVAEGVKNQNGCPYLESENKTKLEGYLSQFNFE
jgi:ArsR family metal-binding transcriptional regulator